MNRLIDRMALVGALVGCACAKHEIDVGLLANTPATSWDLTGCYGDETHCEPPEGEPPLLEIAPQAVECPPDPERPLLELAWSEVVSDGDIQIAVAPDGSLWVAGAVQPDQTSLFIERYSRRGELLSRAEHAIIGGHDVQSVSATSLVFGKSDRAFVVASTTVADKARAWVEMTDYWFVELDEHGQQVGEPIAIEDVREVIATVGDDGALLLAVSRTAQVAALGRVDRGGSLAWVQDQTRMSYPAAIAIDDRARVFVMGQAARLLSPLDNFRNYMAMFDEGGNVVWEIEPPSFRGSFVLSDDGGVFISGDLLATESEPQALQLAKLDDAGKPVWSKQIVTGLATSSRLGADTDENLYVLVATEGSAQDVVYRFDRDGEHCTQAVAPEGISTLGMRVTSDGVLFVHAYVDGLGQTVGMIEP